jgi:hypothetical protein
MGATLDKLDMCLITLSLVLVFDLRFDLTIDHKLVICICILSEFITLWSPVVVFQVLEPDIYHS